MELKEIYSFAEIKELQKLPLNEKIKISVAVLKKSGELSKQKMAIAFSGGKDSQVVADMVERFCPEIFARCYLMFGNTGVEFPESLKFAREYGREHFGDRFYETSPMELEKPELRYEFARELIARLEQEGALNEVLKTDGKLAGQDALIRAAKKRGYVLDKTNCFFPGHRMDFMYCLEQYGAPLLGKAASKLDAHRINIDCFLKYSTSSTENDKLKDYYAALRDCKFSQHCCKLLKKEPSERLQAKLGVDVIIKGLMAEESHTRMINVSTRGHIFKSSRPHCENFYHCSPIAMWTERDVWNYISFFKLKYSSLYDIEYEDSKGETRHIERNGCMFCGTDLLFRNNHLSILRKTHPKAYEVCMEKFGYRKALHSLFQKYNKRGILEAMTVQGATARLLFSVGGDEGFSRIRPCAYDEIGDMMDVAGTGMDAEYDSEALED